MSIFLFLEHRKILIFSEQVFLPILFVSNLYIRLNQIVNEAFADVKTSDENETPKLYVSSDLGGSVIDSVCGFSIIVGM